MRLEPWNPFLCPYVCLNELDMMCKNVSSLKTLLSVLFGQKKKRLGNILKL